MNTQIFLPIAAFLFGTLVGSFLNVVILRLPRNQRLNGRSHCPHCGRTLSPLELIPVVSYLVLRGTCKGCKTKISPRYAIIESLTGLLFMGAAFYFRPEAVVEWLVLAKVWLILSVLLVVFVIDLEHFLILDSVLLAGSLGVIILSVGLDFLRHIPVYSWQGATLPSLLAAAVCPIPFFLIWYFSSGQWMGFGDVKLAIFLGLALGWPLAAVSIFLGVCLGGVTGIGLLAAGKKQLKSRVPFGTFLSVGAGLTMFYGLFLLHWYLSLLGF